MPYRDDPPGAEVTEGALDDAGAAVTRGESAQVRSVRAETVFIVYYLFVERSVFWPAKK
jgi:hypothetical protein